MERGGPGDVDDAQPLEELRTAVAGEGDEAPEHERVGDAHDRLLGDDLRLEDDLAEEPRRARGQVPEVSNAPPAPAHELETRVDLRREEADEHDDEQGEDQRRTATTAAAP